MSIKVKLLLPDNLQSTYLRGEFIESGAVYFTGVPRSIPSLDTNKTSLRFSFELADSETLLEVPINRIVSLEISNDPEFDPAATVTIEDWPAGGGYLTDTDYQVELDTDYFFDLTGTAEAGRTTSGPGTGMFEVQNWPLSANGGLSTVYFRAVIEADNDDLDQCVYPDGYGIFDQIFWQSELPSTPGLPNAVTKQPGWTGRRTPWRFTASEEGATGLYNNGVSRYLMTSLEFRGDTMISTLGMPGSLNFGRTVGNTLSPTLTGITGYTSDYDSTSPEMTVYLPNPGVSVGTEEDVVYTEDVVALSDLVIPGGGVSVYSTGTVTLADATPDFCAQAHFRVELDEPDVTAIMILRAYEDPLPIGGTNSNEMMIVVEVPPTGPALAQFVRIVDGATYMENQMALPLFATAELLHEDGGTIELYIQNRTEPTADNQMVVEAFYTRTGSEESIFLGSAIAQKFGNTDDLGVGFECNSEDGDLTLIIDELVGVSGKFILAADVGDCQSDDIIGDIHHSTQSSGAALGGLAASNAVLIKYYDIPVGGAATVTGNVNSIDGLYFSATGDANSRAYSETQATVPTFSDRVLIDVEFEYYDVNTDGEFYVALSPTPSSSDEFPLTDLPMGVRADELAGHLDTTISAPTLLVVFSQPLNKVMAVMRLKDNTLAWKDLCFYDQINGVCQIEVDNTLGDTADGCWITLRAEDEVLTCTQLQHKLPSAINGLGYYVGFGVRTLHPDYGGAGDEPEVGVHLTSLGVRGLVPKTGFGADDLLLQRHYAKSAAGASYLKPLLGQKMIAGLTDHNDYGHDTPLLKSAAIRTVVAATTGEEIDVSDTHPTLVIDGVTITDTQYVLLKDQSDPNENGVYQWIDASNLLVKSSDFDNSYVYSSSLDWVIVSGGSINEGTVWYATTEDVYGVYSDIDNTGVPFIFVSTLFAQRLEIGYLGAFFATLHPQLFEIKAKALDFTGVPGSVSVKFFEDASGSIGSNLTDWVKVDTSSSQHQTTTGTIASMNNLVQADLLEADLAVTSNIYIWAVVQMPSYSQLGTANFKAKSNSGLVLDGLFRGWTLVDDMWHKLHAKKMQRYDNVYHGGVLQTRVIADSHARLLSQGSALSFDIGVDLEGPQSGSSGRPSVSTSLPPSVRTVSLQITAEDEESGPLAFRVAYEAMDGAIHFTEWQNWAMFADGDAVLYTIYLYGEGALQTDGYRKIWVQAMDGVGNISEAYPITVYAQPVLLVDTVPPTGSLDFVNASDGEVINADLNRNGTLKVQSTDRTTGTKDVRLREIGAGVASDWESNWRPFTEYTPWYVNPEDDDDEFVDGLKRVEAQFRDFGNNIIEIEPLWDVLYETATLDETLIAGTLKHRGYVFVNSLRWQSPYDSEENLYLSAIRHQEFEDFELVNAGDPFYVDNKAFYAISTTTGAVGRKLLFRTTDDIEVTGASSEYTIDADRGLIVFDDVEDGSMTVTVVRSSAVIMYWDGNAVLRAADLGRLGEKAILSMRVVGEKMVLGGGSGNIWAYDGRIVSGPLFTIADDSTNLPITALWQHEFSHEDDTYLYAATAIKPRLYRVSASTIYSGAEWTRVAETGFLDSSSGDITCMESAFDILFLGTNSGKVLRYERFLVTSADDEETESLAESVISNSHLGISEGDVPPVTDLLVSGGQVFASLGDRPEVWSYTIKLRDLPVRKEDWGTTVFDKKFRDNPTPIMFYCSSVANQGNTTALNNPSLEWQMISEPETSSGLADIMLVTGVSGAVTQFTAAEGSDWEQLMSTFTSTGIFNPVLVATTENISLTGLQTIDGVVLTAGQSVLVKDQTVAEYNGIYEAAAGAWVRRSDCDDSDTGQFVENKSVKVTSGSINAGSTWLMRLGESFALDENEMNWATPTYMVEMDMMQISNVANARQGFQIADGYFMLDVSVGLNDIILTSGSKTQVVSFGTTGFSAFALGAGEYATSGVKRIWDFASGSTQEDHGPYWVGDDDVSIVGSLDGWVADKFVEDLVLDDYSESESATFTDATHFLNVQIADGGNPRIVWSDTTGPKVDSQSKLFVRMEVTGDADVPRNAKIRMSWLDNAEGIHQTWVEGELLRGAGGYYTYVFEPSWSGQVKSLALELVLPEDDSTRPDEWHIDYVAIAGSGFGVNFRDHLTNVRIGVEGRRVKLWVGKNERPLWDEAKFLTLPTNLSLFRFGKLDFAQAGSTWGWRSLKIRTNEVVAPVYRDVRDFAIAWRFPSTGGVRHLVNHLGTAWALTDGIPPYSATVDGEPIFKLADNPDDRASKCFSYVSEKQVWKQESPFYPRRTDGSGVIRPLTAESFRNTLVVGGQHGQIKFE